MIPGRWMHDRGFMAHHGRLMAHGQQKGGAGSTKLGPGHGVPVSLPWGMKHQACIKRQGIMVLLVMSSVWWLVSIILGSYVNATTRPEYFVPDFRYVRTNLLGPYLSQQSLSDYKFPAPAFSCFMRPGCNQAHFWRWCILLRYVHYVWIVYGFGWDIFESFQNNVGSFLTHV